MTARSILRRGTRLGGRYRLLGRLHRSNHFDVFDAWDDVRWARCVVKTPRPDRRAAPATARTLRREGRRLMRLEHPHLVRAWDIGDDPVPYVVLETLTGQTLARHVEASEPLDAVSTAWLGVHLVSACRYLHAHGLLHLDLKPANVVADGARAVVLDLSVARPPGRMRAGLGTWCYMAPEQARGGDVGAAADVWGIGMVLFELVTGEQALADVPGDTPQLGGRPPALRTVRRIAGPLAGTVDACLRADPRDRPTLPELGAALTRVTGVDLPS